MSTLMHMFTKPFENLSDEISEEVKGYWRSRLRHAVHDALWHRFSELQAKEQISKKTIADRLNMNPAQVTRSMNFPSNLTLDSVCDLFLAMNCTADILSCRMDHDTNRSTWRIVEMKGHSASTGTQSITAALVDPSHGPVSTKGREQMVS